MSVRKASAVVMVSPGTHLVKIMSPSSKTQGVMLGPLNQTVNLETDAKTLYYSLLKLKNSPSIYYFLKCGKDYKNKYAPLNNSHRNQTNRIFYQEIFKSINQSLHPNCNTCHEFILPLWEFLCFRDTDWGNKITE